MHRCLSILDILGIIFNIIVDGPKFGSKSGSKTLFALACTCRTFQDTALNVLWRSIPSLVPLIKCLPPDAWDITISKESSLLKVLSLKRPTVLSDWARCKFYAPRIRHLGVGQNYFFLTEITVDVAAALEQFKVLPLPNLQVYHCEGTCSVGSLAFSRKLLELEISYRSQDDALHLPSLVNSLKTASPLLQKLAISRSYNSSFELPNDFGTIIASLTKLETLSLVNLALPDEALQFLASSTAIRVLESDNSPEDFLRCLPDSGPIFPELRELSFYTCDLEEISSLIDHIALRRLRSIAVAFDEDTPMQEFEVQDFFEILKDTCDLTILTSICLVQRAAGDFPDFEDDDWEYTIATFQPLLAFPNLHTLCLHGLSIRYQLCNADMKRMVAAWPLMRRFELTYDVDSDIDAEHEPIMDLDGLLHISKWPKLESLSLTFNACVSGDIVTSNKPGAGDCCPLLTALDVGYSSVTSSNAVVAAILSDIFLNLGEIHSDPDWEMWSDIMEIITVMQKVCKQEQMWAEKKFIRAQ